MAKGVSDDLEIRSRALYEESVATIDPRCRSRLTAARHAALDAAVGARGRIRRAVPRWSWAVAGVAAALLIAVVLRVAMPIGGASGRADGRGRSADAANLVASVGSTDDSIEMMREDADFYTWAAGASADDSRSE